MSIPIPVTDIPEFIAVELLIENNAVIIAAPIIKIKSMRNIQRDCRCRLSVISICSICSLVACFCIAIPGILFLARHFGQAMRIPVFFSAAARASPHFLQLNHIDMVNLPKTTTGDSHLSFPFYLFTYPRFYPNCSTSSTSILSLSKDYSLNAVRQIPLCALEASW